MKHLIIFLSIFSIWSSAASTIEKQENRLRFKSGTHALHDLIKDYAKITKKNVVLGSRIPNRKIAISSFSAMTEGEAHKFFTSVLYSQSLMWSHVEGMNLYHVNRARDSEESALPVVTNIDQLPDSYEFVTYIFKPKFALAEQLAKRFRRIVSDNGRLFGDEDSNTIIIVEAAPIVKKIVDILKVYDTATTAKSQQQGLNRWYREKESQLNAVIVDRSNIREGNSKILFVLFTLIGIVFGFICRGYLIRRIEGGF